jgi:hypothetical protein
MKHITVSPIGDSWGNIRSELLTSEEISKTNKKITKLRESMKSKQSKIKD